MLSPHHFRKEKASRENTLTNQQTWGCSTARRNNVLFLPLRMPLTLSYQIMKHDKHIRNISHGDLEYTVRITKKVHNPINKIS